MVAQAALQQTAKRGLPKAQPFLHVLVQGLTPSSASGWACFWSLSL